MIEYKKKGYLVLVWVGGKCIGDICRLYRVREKEPCVTCGHQEHEHIVNGFGLTIYNRLFGPDDELVPKQVRNGYSGRNFKRLKDAKQWVEETFG